ncbi:MAG: hypothetical protein ACYTGH_07810, partial [Planctomycetota bacterium]
MTVRRKRSRFKVLPLVVGGVLVAGFALIPATVEREPLSSREILEKQEWEEEELVEAISRQGLQPKRRGTRQEVMQHLRTQVRKLPEERRREVMKKSVLRSVKELKQQWSSLEPKMRESLVKT